MDTLSFHLKNTQKAFKTIRIKDGKFHKQIKNDTVTIKFKENGNWVKEKYVIINDSRIK
ncbi:MAG: hypothetical protein LBT29_00215 [Flavobacteriaceae bacterium]|nr:hypothetical protein [Flavobacteriaceae bacterium]